MSNCPWGRSFPNLSKVKSFNEDELRWLGTGTVISQGKYTVNQTLSVLQATRASERSKIRLLCSEERERTKPWY